MKLTLLILSLVSLQAFARGTYVQGHYRSNGTYVEPYHRTESDNSTFNNYSTKGNINPYTGKVGTKDPYNYGN